MNEVGNRIKRLRKIKKLSQEKLAKLINLSRGAIGNYEIGTTEPKYENYKALASSLGTTVNFLKHGDRLLVSNDLNNTIPYISNKEFPKFPIKSDSTFHIDQSVYQDEMYAIESSTSEMYPIHKDGDILLCIYGDLLPKENMLVHYEYQNKIGVRRIKIDPISLSIVLIPINMEEHEIFIISKNERKNLKFSKIVGLISFYND